VAADGRAQTGPRREGCAIAETRPRAVFAALGANLGIALTKFVAFVVTGSSSLLAESVHSLADTANQALLLVGRRRARRAGTMEHPFGFGAERYFYGFLVAVVLFTGGGAFSLYEGWHKVLHPHPVRDPLVAFIVLGVAVALSIRLPIAAAAALVGLFALFHGHAHGSELPETASALAYGLGFVAATAALHGFGIALGVLLRRDAGRLLVRLGGAGVAATGLALAAVL